MEMIKPCPFCKDEEIDIQSYLPFVSITEYFNVACGLCGVQGVTESTRKQAIENWNKRR